MGKNNKSNNTIHTPKTVDQTQAGIYIAKTVEELALSAEAKKAAEKVENFSLLHNLSTYLVTHQDCLSTVPSSGDSRMIGTDDGTTISNNKNTINSLKNGIRIDKKSERSPQNHDPEFASFDIQTNGNSHTIGKVRINIDILKAIFDTHNLTAQQNLIEFINASIGRNITISYKTKNNKQDKNHNIKHNDQKNNFTLDINLNEITPEPISKQLYFTNKRYKNQENNSLFYKNHNSDVPNNHEEIYNTHNPQEITNELAVSGDDHYNNYNEKYD